MFAMGIYLLHMETRKAMDSPRARFFWEGAGNLRKYHMVDWLKFISLRSFGIWASAILRLMNMALMMKWIWKLYQNAEGLWADLL
jgi:hypothetical protein